MNHTMCNDAFRASSRTVLLSLALAFAPLMAAQQASAAQAAPMPPIVVLDGPVVRGMPDATVVGWPGGSAVEVRRRTATDYAAPSGNPTLPGASPVWWAPAPAIGSRIVVLPVFPAGTSQVPTSPQVLAETSLAVAVTPCVLAQTDGWAVRLDRRPASVALVQFAGPPIASRDEMRVGPYNNHPGFANAQTLTTPTRTVAVIADGASTATPLALYRADCR